MKNIFNSFILLLFPYLLCSQVFNNSCETALEITGLPFRNDTTFSASVPNGINAPYTALIEEEYRNFDSQSFTASSLGSQDCKGYQNETSLSFRDTWYKKGLDSHRTERYPLFILCSDTVHISFYYGTCENLYQNLCLTLEPGYYDGRTGSGFSISQGMLNAGDSIFVQISYPDKLEPYSNTFIAFGKRPSTWPYTGVYYATYDKEVIRIESTNIENNNGANVEIYPNPFSDVINLNEISNIQRIKMYNSLGELIFESENTNSFKEIETTFYNKGMYYLKLETKNNHSLVKLLFKT